MDYFWLLKQRHFLFYYNCRVKKLLLFISMNQASTIAEVYKSKPTIADSCLTTKSKSIKTHEKSIVKFVKYSS